MRADTARDLRAGMRQEAAWQGPAREETWVPVCRVDQLRLELGVAALVSGEQVAIFRLGVQEIRAIGNLDPYSQANVLSRGIVGSRGEVPFVASPVYKQPFDLRTGHCLDDPDVSVSTFDVRVIDGVVEVLAPGEPLPATQVSPEMPTPRTEKPRE